MSETHYTWFDRYVARKRHEVAREYILPDSRVCDVGCGVDALLLREIASVARFSVGVDYQELTTRVPKTAFVKADVNFGLPFKGGIFEHVTLLAVIEHLKDPRVAFREAYRVLAADGSLIVTWPNAIVDPLLDVLCRVRIVSRKTEVDKHEPRRPAAYWIQSLIEIGFEGISHRTFEMGLNNILVGYKRRPRS